jgi:hypothetical protein
MATGWEFRHPIVILRATAFTPKGPPYTRLAGYGTARPTDPFGPPPRRAPAN